MSDIYGLIHANWCGHCQSLMPEWNAMKDGMNAGELENLVEIEAGDASDIKEEKFKKVNAFIDGGEKLRENGYPTLFKVSHKKLYQYGGDRTATAMKEWFLLEEKEEKKGGKSKKSRKGKKSKKSRKSRKSRK